MVRPFYQLLPNVTGFVITRPKQVAPRHHSVSITWAIVGTRHLSWACISGFRLKWAKQSLPFPSQTFLLVLSEQGPGVPAALSKTYNGSRYSHSSNPPPPLHSTLVSRREGEGSWKALMSGLWRENKLRQTKAPVMWWSQPTVPRYTGRQKAADWKPRQMHSV